MFSVIVTSCVSSDTQAYHSTMEEELQAHSQEVMALRAVVGSYKVQEAQHKRSEPHLLGFSQSESFIQHPDRKC